MVISTTNKTTYRLPGEINKVEQKKEYIYIILFIIKYKSMRYGYYSGLT